MNANPRIGKPKGLPITLLLDLPRRSGLLDQLFDCLDTEITAKCANNEICYGDGKGVQLERRCQTGDNNLSLSSDDCQWTTNVKVHLYYLPKEIQPEGGVIMVHIRSLDVVEGRQRSPFDEVRRSGISDLT